MTGNTTVTSGAKDTGPLDWRIAIVDKSGRPTQEFQRKWATQRANNALIGSVTFGTGVPTGSPDDGAEYIDTTKEPWVLYIGENSQWNVVGVQDFIDLDDVPGNYSGSGDHLVRVNGNATGLEFVTVSTGLDGLGNTTGDILVRGNSSWGVLAPGNATTVLTSNGSGATPTWQASSGGGGGGSVSPWYVLPVTPINNGNGGPAIIWQEIWLEVGDTVSGVAVTPAGSGTVVLGSALYGPGVGAGTYPLVGHLTPVSTVCTSGTMVKLTFSTKFTAVTAGLYYAGAYQGSSINMWGQSYASSGFSSGSVSTWAGTFAVPGLSFSTCTAFAFR